MKRRYDIITPIVIGLIIISSIVSGTLVLIFEDELIGQAITTITAIIGACAIWIQMKKNKSLNEGEFIVNLNKQFTENKSIYDLFLKMEKYERTDKSKNPFDEDDIAKVAGYMTFFEVIYSLIVRKIIKIWMIDDLFSYQFFLIMNNACIQELELLPCQEYYINVYKFADLWMKYRKKHDLPILNEKDNILKKLKIDLEINHE
ncbi:MAG: hypothetical protein AB7E09_04175 [Candidatus Izemoplasmatales bacterium]